MPRAIGSGIDGYRHPPYDAMITPPQPDGMPSVASPLRQLLASRLQPGVPAANPDAVPWIGSDPRGTQSDPRIMSDVAPDNDWRPGVQYAQSRGGRGSVPIRIGGQWVELDPGLANRLSMAQAKAQITTARVRELDPSW
jgi:hypothetical protein